MSDIVRIWRRFENTVGLRYDRIYMLTKKSDSKSIDISLYNSNINTYMNTYISPEQTRRTKGTTGL